MGKYLGIPSQSNAEPLWDPQRLLVRQYKTMLRDSLKRPPRGKTSVIQWVVDPIWRVYDEPKGFRFAVRGELDAFQPIKQGIFGSQGMQGFI